ncbi:MAG TPA: sensor histidine kinase [Candidatus Limnocylindrales bacterium]
MDAAFAAPEPLGGDFDGLHAEAKAAVAVAANALRDVRTRYREAYADEQARWQELRDELDALERRALDAVRGPRLLTTAEDHDLAEPDVATQPPGEIAALSAIAGLAPLPAAPGPAPRVRTLRVHLDEAAAALDTHQTELGRLELAIRTLESTWLFLERGDVSLVGDTTAPANLADLQMRIVEAQEGERARLAQEVHDGPAQALSNAIFQVEFIERVVGTDQELASAELRFLRDLLRRELGDVRTFITQLRPPILDEMGLDGAIRDAAEHLRSLIGIAVDVQIDAPTTSLAPAEQMVVLRIAQEALQNVRKHASASAVSVRTTREDGAWVLEIRDDGRGFDGGAVAARGRRNYGLQFMRERAELIGARFDVRSNSDKGTVVRLAIPKGAEETR